MAEVKRKKNETFESLLRRFNKRIMQSGKVLQARKIRYEKRPVNKNRRRESTLFRIEARRKHDYLKKVGKLIED